jgi:hypothetical protein
MSTMLQVFLLISPLLLLVLVIFWADRGRDPGNVFTSRQKREDESARRLRADGDTGGSYVPIVNGGKFSNAGDAGGGDCGGGGD